MTEYCEVCGKAKVRFENPERYICTNTHSESKKQQASAKNAQKMGKANKGRKDLLDNFKGKRGKKK